MDEQEAEKTMSSILSFRMEVHEKNVKQLLLAKIDLVWIKAQKLGAHMK